jgi:RNA recognition motif-containing protein
MRTIVVSNLPAGTTRWDLKCFFLMFGPVPEISFPRRGGYALLTFKDEDHAKQALEANGKRMSGRRIRVKMARWEVF